MDINYVGEELIFGKAGNLFIALAFSGALLAAFAYFFSFRNNDDSEAWKRIARWSFAIHSVAVAGIFVILYYLFFNHRFEYYYVWQHSSSILPQQYIFASFWEGQEGSFLLWAFWHVVLSWVIISKGGKWEAYVMFTIVLVQAFLISMVLGVHIGDIKIGSNPFILLRQHPDMASLPFVQMPDYLQRLDDGRGLNPLLQNYWMVIHPPTLFLGFASTLIPFAYAMAGLMRKKANEWTIQALPWTYFSMMTLGAGILMGAAWAYEALSFGGFWAWDPVENASLVPWLVLAGASHVLLINKKNGTGLLSAISLVSLTFLLVLYSTFLTRSGILGDTSVHAFTDLGMSGQLLLYMGFFVVMAVGLMVYNRKSIRANSKDDSIYSREFWMFIGMLVLVISAIQVTFTTSIPVFNKIFGTSMAPPANAINHYNSWQIPFAIVIAMLAGFGQYMKYRETPPRFFWKKIVLPLIISLLIAGWAAYELKFERAHYVALLFASIFAIVSNIDYLIRVLKGKLSVSGGSIAHAGLGMILLGSLISNGKSQVISRNVLNVDLGKDF
ncbi:MAG TPA: cytochrome c biogenesis protein CcsA, partial [Bacteroidia bacterium]|nr:cytochrome c biogenesis protein CcsA [Bacteroidia bacterium]